MKPEEVFMLFVAGINRPDVEALTALMAPNHTFIDSVGRPWKARYRESRFTP